MTIYGIYVYNLLGFLYRARGSPEKHNLVTFMTNAGVTNYNGNSPLHPDGVLERLVRSEDRLVARVSVAPSQ